MIFFYYFTFCSASYFSVGTAVSRGALFQYWNHPAGKIWQCFHDSYFASCRTSVG